MHSVSWSPYWGNELDLLELGGRFLRGACDEANSIEHRLCRANSETYGRPPRHWQWEVIKYRERRMIK